MEKLDNAFSKNVFVRGRLNSSVEPKSDKDLIRYVVKAMAMEACAEENKAVHRCMKQSWFSACSVKQREYWNCYRKATIRLRKEYGVYLDDWNYLTAKWNRKIYIYKNAVTMEDNLQNPDQK